MRRVHGDDGFLDRDRRRRIVKLHSELAIDVFLRGIIDPLAVKRRVVEHLFCPQGGRHVVVLRGPGRLERCLKRRRQVLVRVVVAAYVQQVVS